MEHRHLRYFIAVAEELHFGRAAERLHIAQPSLSQQIHALEHELGVALFTRTKRSVALTSAGELFLAEAYKVLTQAEHAVQVAQRAGRGELGTLRIGFLSSAAYGNLPRIIRAFRERAPQVTLELRELTTPDLLRALEAGEVDIGFFRLEESRELQRDTQGLCWEATLREPYMVALPEAHRLARQRTIALAELHDEAFVLFPRRLNPSLHDMITQHCREAGFEPSITQEATLMQTLIALVAAGLGITFAPAAMCALRLEGVRYRPLVSPGIETQQQAAWRAGDVSAPLQAFLVTMRELIHA